MIRPTPRVPSIHVPLGTLDASALEAAADCKRRYVRLCELTVEPYSTPTGRVYRAIITDAEWQVVGAYALTPALALRKLADTDLQTIADQVVRRRMVAAGHRVTAPQSVCA